MRRQGAVLNGGAGSCRPARAPLKQPHSEFCLQLCTFLTADCDRRRLRSPSPVRLQPQTLRAAVTLFPHADHPGRPRAWKPAVPAVALA